MPPVVTQFVIQAAIFIPSAFGSPREHHPSSTVDTSTAVSACRSHPVQLVRIVPPSGNLTVAQQQVWIGPALAGTRVIQVAGQKIQVGKVHARKLA